MKTKLERFSHLRYTHSLLVRDINRGIGFMVSERGLVKFDETNPEIDLSCYEMEGLKIGDFVKIKEFLENPWDSNPDTQEGRYSDKPFQIVAFVRLKAKVKKVSVYGTFCVLRRENSNIGDSFLMAKEKSDKIALYFINALELDTDQSF